MLATQADVEARLQIIFDQDPDPVVTALLEAATGLIQDYCDQHLEAQDDLEVTLDGGGAAWLFVPETPIRAVTSVVEDGRVLTLDDYLWYPHGSLLRRRCRWTCEPRSVVVTYDAGYETVPEGLKAVCAGMAGRALVAGAQLLAGDAEDGRTIESEGIGSYNVAYAEVPIEVALSQLNVSVDDRLALGPYRREPLA